jgi:high-affinity iron transporter
MYGVPYSTHADGLTHVGAGIVTLREGFEAALVVVLVLAFLNRTGQRADLRAIWAGVAAAVAVSVAAAAGLLLVGAELEGNAEAVFEGATMIVAAALLTWMIFWMRRKAGSLRGEIERQVGQALAASSGFALGAVVFVGVVREGLETALLLFSSVGSEGDLATGIGAAVGLALAVSLAYLFYRGVGHLDLRRFFQVTSVLLLVFAAWLLARGLEELAEAGVLPESEQIAWLTFVALAVPTLYFFFRKPGRRAA